MKNALGKIVTIVIVLAVGYWIVSGIISIRRAGTEKQAAEQAANAEEQKVQAEKLLKIKKSVQNMVTKYDAVTDWQGSLEKDGIEPIFTVEFQDLLIRKDSRPLVFVAAVEDIVRDSNNYIAHFHNSYNTLLSADVHFVLDCTPEQVQEIMKQSIDSYLNYAVITQISGVRKVNLELTAHAEDIISSDEYSFEVDISSRLEPSDTFVATGRCLDLLFVEYYDHEDLLEIPSK